MDLVVMDLVVMDLEWMRRDEPRLSGCWPDRLKGTVGICQKLRHLGQPSNWTTIKVLQEKPGVA